MCQLVYTFSSDGLMIVDRYQPSLPPPHRPYQSSAKEAQSGRIKEHHRGGNRDICMQVDTASSQAHFQRELTLAECISRASF